MNKREIQQASADTELITRTKQGDRSAFDRLYELNVGKIYKNAYLIAGNKEDAEDIVQETFIKCFLYAKQIRNSERFVSWLMQIMHRTAWEHLRKARVERPSEEEVEREFEAKAAGGYPVDECLERMIREEESSMIRMALATLSVKHRSVLVYHYYGGLSVEEIATICECSRGTVKSRLFGARRKLKEAMEQVQKKGEGLPETLDRKTKEETGGRGYEAI